MVGNVIRGKIDPWSLDFFFSPIFSPNLKDSILVGLGRKILDPNTIHLVTKHTKTCFLSHFLSLVFHSFNNHPNQTHSKGLFSWSGGKVERSKMGTHSSILHVSPLFFLYFVISVHRHFSLMFKSSRYLFIIIVFI